MSVTNTTANLNLPLPYADNPLIYDVQSLITALTMIDTAIAARTTTAAVNSAVSAAVNALVGGAPSALDTLKELADAVNDDANFAASVTTALAGKAPTVHQHAITDITGLATALAGKLSNAPATSAVLGGVKVGGGLLVAADGTLSVATPNNGNGIFSDSVLTPSSNGQMVFTPAGGYVAGTIELFLHGVMLFGNGEDYTANDGVTITLNSGINTTDIMILRRWQLVSVSNAVAKSGDTMVGVFNEAKGNSVASAATVDLDNVTGNLIHITGNNTISAISLASGAARDVIFDGALTLVKSANLDLPSSTNIVTVAGARARLRGDGSGKVIMMTYVPPTTTGNTGAQAFATAVLLNQFYGVF